MVEKGASVIDENISLQEVRDLFKHDRFASEIAGCRIKEAERGHSVVEMEITPAHLNVQGTVMGGAIFTLGDFATAIAGNIGQDPSISTSANIRYLTIPKGKRLIATCTADRMGRSLGSFTVKIQDDLGNIVAIMTSTLYRLSHE